MGLNKLNNLSEELANKIKKGEREFTFFCPKSTMNLTYLCYGGSKIDVICLMSINNRRNASFLG